MSGVYIHIPFCAKKCFYCDFYTTLSLKQKKEYLIALTNELKKRQDYTQDKEIGTIYFGGGTPSLLKPLEIQNIIDEISKVYTLNKDAEITLEANPDDINEQYVNELKETKVNRISIGLQSFFDEDLKLMNRRHSAKENYKAVELLQKQGFTNISGDLIYGLPKTNTGKWRKNLAELFALNIPHLSAYYLSYEPNTVFTKFLKKGKIKELPEDESIKQFELLIAEAEKNDFIHYETSNFAKKGFFSKHNTGYWKQKHYIGLGASAHSYNGISRQFNVSNISKYLKGAGDGKGYFQKEDLSITDKYNDYVIVSLRTMWGVDLNYVKKNFPAYYYNFIIEKANKLIEQNLLFRDGQTLKTTHKGKFIEDNILLDLFFEEKK